MKLTDELKILDDKIKTNQAQYDLDREATKIFALSSKELDKYGHLTREHLGYEPGVAEEVKFEQSPMGKTFNKGLEKADRKKGLLEWLKNIESKNEEQLKAIKNQDEKQILILTNKTLQPDKLEKSTLKMYLLKIN